LGHRPQLPWVVAHRSSRRCNPCRTSAAPPLLHSGGERVIVKSGDSIMIANPTEYQKAQDEIRALEERWQR